MSAKYRLARFRRSAGILPYVRSMPRVPSGRRAPHATAGAWGVGVALGDSDGVALGEAVGVGVAFGSVSSSSAPVNATTAKIVPPRATARATIAAVMRWRRLWRRSASRLAWYRASCRSRVFLFDIGRKG